MLKITVVIGDDHPAFREGLSRLLNDETDIQCVGKAADGLEVVLLVKESRPNVAIIDVSMPNLNGIEAVKQIKAACPGTAILIVSAFDYHSYVLASLQAGALGYMSKDRPLSELVSAIRLVNNGDSVIGIKTTDKIMNHLTGGYKGDRVFKQLLPREIEVLRLAAKGMSNKGIAAELIISERTVQTHLVNIFKKLQVNSRTQAVLHALTKGWLTLDDLS